MTRLVLLIALSAAPLLACEAPSAPPAEAPTPAPSPAPEAPPAPLDPAAVKALLRPADLADIPGLQGPLVEDTLQGIPNRPDYASARLRPADAPQAHGVALQLWREGPQAAQQRMELHRRSYKAPSPTRKAPGEGFFSVQSGLLHLCWRPTSAPGEVRVLTCPEAVCDQAQLSALAHKLGALP